MKELLFSVVRNLESNFHNCYGCGYIPMKAGYWIGNNFEARDVNVIKLDFDTSEIDDLLSDVIAEADEFIFKMVSGE